MSACISREGEYSDHTDSDEPFVCGRCGAEDWTAAMDEIATLTAQRDKAERRHERLESGVEAACGWGNGRDTGGVDRLVPATDLRALLAETSGL